MNTKALVEKRNSLVEEVNALFEKAETEVRAFSDEENEKYDALTKEIQGIDDMMKKAERSFEPLNVVEQHKEVVEEAQDAKELRMFGEFIRENRADEMAKGDNGAVIPTTIANKIIDRVKEICPIYARATKYHVKGRLDFPIVDQSKAISTAYQNEFTELTSSNVGFKSVSIDGFLVGALSKVSLSLINNAQFDIVNFVVNKVAESITLFLEKELLFGTEDKMQGVISDTTGNVVKVETADAVPTTDELIEIQSNVAQAYQGNCVWIMSTANLTKLRQVKDGEGRYVLNPDLTNGFGYSLLGKPVVISDQLGDANVIYGDLSAIYVNIHEDINVTVMREQYLTQHALGVCAWLEMDSKVIEPQKLVYTAKKATKSSK